MTRFTAAADWLQHITGTTPPDVAPESDSAMNEMLARDAQHMSELEARDRSKEMLRVANKKADVAMMSSRKGAEPSVSGYYQPMPRSVAGKAPPKSHQQHQQQRSQKGGGSNRLGDQLHFA